VRVFRGFASLWLALGAIACVQPVGVEGRPCPCATALGFACCESNQVCVASDKASAPSCRQGPGAATDGGVVIDAPGVDAPADLADQRGPEIGVDVADMRDVADVADVADVVDVPEVAEVPPAPCPEGAGRVRVRYFNSFDFTEPKLERPATELNFDWGGGSPGAGVGRENWSAIIRGQVQPQVTGDHTFRVRSDQGVWFWLAGQPELSLHHRPVAGRPVEFTVELLAGRKYELVIHYVHDTGPAFLDVRWQPPGQPLQPIPACALYPDSLYNAFCISGDEPCRLNDVPTCPAYDGLGVEGEFFATENFGDPIHREQSLTFGLNWKFLVSEMPDLIRTRSIRFQGKVRLPRPGAYSFYLVADPTADTQVTVDGHTRQLKADGSGVIRELRVDVPRRETMEYRITIDYVMRVPPDQSLLGLYWKSDAMAKQEIPLCFLYNPAEVLR
jgi:hypothetical protein